VTSLVSRAIAVIGKGCPWSEIDKGDLNFFEKLGGGEGGKGWVIFISLFFGWARVYARVSF